MARIGKTRVSPAQQTAHLRDVAREAGEAAQSQGNRIKQLEASIQGNQHVEMQEDEGDAEMIASMLNRMSPPANPPRTAEQIPSPTKPGLFTTAIMAVGSRVGSMFSAAPKSPTAGIESNNSRKRTADDPPSAERDEKRLRTNAEAGHKKTLLRPTIINARLPGYVSSDDHSVKRASAVSGRGDPYDVPDEEPKDSPEPAAKKGRTRGQKGAKESKKSAIQTAKKTLLKDKQTRKGEPRPQLEMEEQEGDGEKGDEVEQVSRQTRASSSRQVEAERFWKKPDSLGSLALIENSLAQGKMRKPGRPRKEKPPKAAHGEEHRITAAEDSHHSHEGSHHSGDANGTSSPRFTRQEKAKKNTRSASAINKLAMGDSSPSARGHEHERGNPLEDDEDVHESSGEEGSAVDQPTTTIGGTEGLESIQLDLSKSPTKARPHFPPAQKSATERPPENPTVNGLSLEGRNQASDEESNSDEDEEERDSEIMPSQPVAITLSRGPFTESRLDQMRKACDSMGTNKIGKAFATDGPFTPPGQSIVKASKELFKLYEYVQKIESGESPERGKLQESLDEISNIVAGMQEHVTTIVNDQLGRPEQSGGEDAEKSPKIVMKDVYLYILPALVKVLGAAVDTFEHAGHISEPDIEALMIFIRMMSRITNAASLEHNKKCRPEKTGFRMARPFNIIGHIVGEINAEYRMIKDTEKKAAREERKRRFQAHEERLRLEAEERNEEDEKLEREAKRVRLHEEYLEQQRQKIKAKEIEQQKAKERERRDALESLEDMNRMLVERGLPPLELSLSQPQASQRLSQAQMSALSQGPTPSQDGEEQEIPEGGWTITEKRIRLEKEARALKEEAERVAEAAQEAERQLRKLKQEEERALNGSQGDEPERILVFGVNNVHSKPKKPTMSTTEIMAFIELLKVNLGPDRYEIIAAQLDRSLEDIFLHADIVKDMMLEWQTAEGFEPEDYWMSIGQDRP